MNNETKIVSTFAERFNLALEKRGLNREKFAHMVNLSSGTISNYVLNRYKPKAGRTYYFAQKLRVNILWLMGYNVPMEENVPDLAEEDKPKTVDIPLLGSIKAGTPFMAEEHLEGYRDVNIKFLKPNKTYYSLRVSDDSMFPEIQAGDVVLIERTNDFKNGDVCVVMINGDEATLKVVKKYKEGVDIIPINPMYQKRRYTSKEAEALPVEIAGVVVRLIDREVKRK